MRMRSMFTLVTPTSEGPESEWVHQARSYFGRRSDLHRRFDPESEQASPTSEGFRLHIATQSSILAIGQGHFGDFLAPSTLKLARETKGGEAYLSKSRRKRLCYAISNGFRPSCRQENRMLTLWVLESFKRTIVRFPEQARRLPGPRGCSLVELSTVFSWEIRGSALWNSQRWTFKKLNLLIRHLVISITPNG